MPTIPHSIDLQTRLAHLTVDVSAAALTTVWPDWRDDDFLPAYNKFYFIVGGEGSVRIAGREYHPQAGELWLMPAGVRQSYATRPDKPFTKYWCHFTASTGGRQLFDMVRVPNLVKVPDLPGLSTRFQYLVDCQADSGLVAVLRRKAAMIEIIALFLEWSGADASLYHLGSDDPLHYVLSHIEENLSRPLVVKDLAEIAHLQQNYFIGQFRKAFGVPPIRYVLLRRIELA